MADDPQAPIAGAAATGRVKCEFCECSLAASGEVLKRSARAKTLMDTEERIEVAARDLDTAKAALVELQTQLDAAKKELEKKSTSIFGG